MFGAKEGKACVIYIRVSSERQVKGYSLEGQKRYLVDCAERQGMKVNGIYVEEGKSGKSIEGRTEFQTMLDEIKAGKLNVDYVLVYKLSRFGRNAKDVLNSLEFIMQYGVHLMCVEDGLDSSTSMGKLMITILGAVAELERENIITQSLLGREEKAKTGGWNGGIAPYGYVLKEGKLIADEEQKKIVLMIFDMFLNKGMGYSTIAGYLNRRGCTREPAHNAVYKRYSDWRADHIKRMVGNPLYTGKMAWGRRRTEKVTGTENEYRLIEQESYFLSEEIKHEPYVSEEDFERAQKKIEQIKEASMKRCKDSTERSHLLSGIARCPECHAPMHVDCKQWTNKDGTKMKRYSYACGHYKRAKGLKPCRRNGISANILENEVLEYTKKLLKNQRFAQDVKEKIGIAVDVTELQNELSLFEKERKRLLKSRGNLEYDIDNLSETDKYIERKREEFNRRLDGIYTKIYETEECIEECKQKIIAVEQESLNVEAIYKILLSFDKIYDKMNDKEKRELMKSMVREIKLFTPEERKEQGRAVRSIMYTFPIEEDVLESLRVSQTHVETCVALSRRKNMDTIEIKMMVDREDVSR